MGIIEIILISILVFCVIFIADVIWVFYIKLTADLNEKYAPNIAMILYIMSAVAVISYTSNILFIIPATLGAKYGTLYAIKFKKYLIENHYDEGAFLNEMLYKIKKFFRKK